MSNKSLYVERRPAQGDYAVRKPGASRASAIESTQAKAIERAKELGALNPRVERVRHTNKGNPDQWRKA